ncbi:MAG: phosphotransferase [Candidatus Heimdallarchaeota archaeon]|nr:phosphotransferase [Candidatus Heimdallarchaeota archaeon]
MEILSNWEVNDCIDITQNKDFYDNNNENNAFLILRCDNFEYVLKKKNINGKHILKIERELLNELKRHNIPVSQMIATKSAGDYLESGNIAYCMYEYISGRTINYQTEIEIETWMKKIGTMLNRLHAVFRKMKYPFEIQNSPDHTLEKLIGQFDTIITRADKVMQNEFLPLRSLIVDNINKIFNSHLEKQLIHRDYHLGNIIVDKKTIKSIIDFDLACFEYKIVDVCYFSNSILNKSIQSDIINKELWLKGFLPFIAAYEDITEVEILLFPNIMVLINVSFLLFFIELNELKYARQARYMMNWVLEHDVEIIKLIKSQLAIKE